MNLKLDNTVTYGLVIFLLFAQSLVLILYANNYAGKYRDINLLDSSYNKLINEKQTYYNEKMKYLNDEIHYYGERDGFLKIESKDVKMLK